MINRIAPRTNEDNVLLKKFLVKVANGKPVVNKKERDRLSTLIMQEICKDPEPKVREYLWNLQNYLFPEN